MSKIIGNTTATPNPQPDWGQDDSKRADYIKNKPQILTEEDVIQIIIENGGTGGGGGGGVQSDWNQTDITKLDYIKNKPTIPSVEGLATTDYVNETIVNYALADEDHLQSTLEQFETYMNNSIKEQILTDYATTQYVQQTIENLPIEEEVNDSSNPVSSQAVKDEFSKFSNAYDKIISDSAHGCREYTDQQVGNIETALDSIIAIQNGLIGG